MSTRLYADTNIIIRFLTDDPPEQAQLVEDMLASLSSTNRELFVCQLVVAEAVYVLESFYKRSRNEIRERLLAFCRLPGVVLEARGLTEAALESYASQQLDYTDAYLVEHMTAAGVSDIFTFDKDFLKLPVMVVNR